MGTETCFTMVYKLCWRKVRTEAELRIVKQIELLSLRKPKVAVLSPPQLRKLFHSVCGIGKVQVPQCVVGGREPVDTSGVSD